MKKEEIRSLREQVRSFFMGNEREFSFKVMTPLESRISTIYRIIFPGSALVRFYIRFTIARIAQAIDFSPIKVFLYRRIGIRIGKGVFISPDVVIDPHFPSLITLGDYCILGWGVKLFCHDFSENIYRMGRITVGRGATIGGFVIVRGGVDIGEMAEIPAGCMVYKNIPPHTKASQVLSWNIKEPASPQ
jgi:acetyltransferase-like isoleucine patch superfamily enzyme